MMKCMCACLFGLMLLVGCKKKEPVATAEPLVAPVPTELPSCAKEIITDSPVKVGETGIVLPVGAKLCLSSDNLEIKVELPVGYNFVANKTLPVYGTYACNCSESGSACKVFYADGLGFGCLQSTCSGSCTGKFTYKGYSVDKLIFGKTDFFNLPEVQKEIEGIKSTAAYSKHSIYGVSFFLVNDEKEFLAGASCDCEGTQACKLKTISFLGKKIYFCEGPCNGCELTT